MIPLNRDIIDNESIETFLKLKILDNRVSEAFSSFLQVESDAAFDTSPFCAHFYLFCVDFFDTFKHRQCTTTFPFLTPSSDTS